MCKSFIHWGQWIEPKFGYLVLSWRFPFWDFVRAYLTLFLLIFHHSLESSLDYFLFYFDLLCIGIIFLWPVPNIFPKYLHFFNRCRRFDLYNFFSKFHAAFFEALLLFQFLLISYFWKKWLQVILKSLKVF